MGASSIGYRFDTLYKNFSNRGLMWGKDTVEVDQYQQYISELQQRQNKFIVATPNDFTRKITVSKLRNWIKQFKLDLVAIDGITYMTDERFVRGDNKTIQLTHISEDLMSLSMEMKVPILIVVQANRGGVVENDSDGTPELETIRDSDGIAQNASKVISIRQTKDGILKLEVKKQRFGSVGGKLNYKWDIDTGDFIFVPSYDDAEPQEKTERKVRDVKRQFKGDKEDVF
jgi:replicative DNA helicase